MTTNTSPRRTSKDTSRTAATQPVFCEQLRRAAVRRRGADDLVGLRAVDLPDVPARNDRLRHVVQTDPLGARSQRPMVGHPSTGRKVRRLRPRQQAAARASLSLVETRACMAEALRLRHRRRRLRRQRAGEPPVRRPVQPRPRARGRPPRLRRGTCSSTCRRRCTFPIGSRFYDWKYESEPEPHMNGRRIYHARGKVLGGSSSINGMIFQRGNPLDYERWARPTRAWRPGTTRTACRTSSGWRPAWRPTRDDPCRGARRAAVLERGPATNPLFGAFFEAVPAGRLPADRRRQRVPPGGLRAVRPQHPPTAAACRPRAPTCTR